ncbi:MAG: 2-amino-4-hydroxy-6-hydroxymethyldihydropteridine diphosphokinase [Thermoguttaceae bacterium]|nr:2-amino-4-hydroxy-6-hydroxymethyldihydropteridine diphosphokinase [Thermoguttaceae bacterium]
MSDGRDLNGGRGDGGSASSVRSSVCGKSHDAASTSALIALGSNLRSEWGAPDKTIRRAVELLAETTAETTTIQAVSSIWQTFPVGGPSEQPLFANAVAALETTLGPFELLEALQEIEREARRVRRIFWGPRTLDLDVILYGDLVLSSPTLIVPHPRAVWRDFVLGPACEIAPERRLPTTGLTLREHRSLLWTNFENFEATAYWTRAVATGAATSLEKKIAS